jgi:hypothetical protein
VGLLIASHPNASCCGREEISDPLLSSAENGCQYMRVSYMELVVGPSGDHPFCLVL